MAAYRMDEFEHVREIGIVMVRRKIAMAMVSVSYRRSSMWPRWAECMLVLVPLPFALFHKGVGAEKRAKKDTKSSYM